MMTMVRPLLFLLQCHILDQNGQWFRFSTDEEGFHDYTLACIHSADSTRLLSVSMSAMSDVKTDG